MDQKDQKIFNQKVNEHQKVGLPDQLKTVNLTRRTKKSPFINALRRENELNKVKSSLTGGKSGIEIRLPDLCLPGYARFLMVGCRYNFLFSNYILFNYIYFNNLI